MEAQAVESLGTKVKVCKDWKAVVREMAQVGRAPEEAAAHQPEKLTGEKPSGKVQWAATIASQFLIFFVFFWKRESRKCGKSLKTSAKLPRVGRQHLSKGWSLSIRWAIGACRQAPSWTLQKTPRTQCSTSSSTFSPTPERLDAA